MLSRCAYIKVTERARGGIEIREYWQTNDISWLPQKKDWVGLTTIGMTRNTIARNGETKTETRYFISSLPLDVQELARAIRGHWMVESYHWHLDVTFREDANHTIDKYAAFNLNIIKKITINTLKLVDVGIKRVSLKNKRYMISMDFGRFFETLMAI